MLGMSAFRHAPFRGNASASGGHLNGLFIVGFMVLVLGIVFLTRGGQRDIHPGWFAAIAAATGVGAWRTIFGRETRARLRRAVERRSRNKEPRS